MFPASFDWCNGSLINDKSWHLTEYQMPEAHIVGVKGKRPHIPVSRRKFEDWGLLWERTDVAKYPKLWKILSPAPVPPAATTVQPKYQNSFCYQPWQQASQGSQCWCENRSIHLFVNFFNSFWAPIVYLEQWLGTGDAKINKCKWHCMIWGLFMLPPST